jgi:G6PDH family F420-dependent oxidoreductase
MIKGLFRILICSHGQAHNRFIISPSRATRHRVARRKSSRPIKIGLDIGENDKDPGGFRDAVVLAEKLGFDVAWLGDHFMPWVHSGNKSAFVWSLLGSCLEATKEIRIGPYVTTPIGGRYHPATIAQASATLDNMYPGRFVLGVGTGEAMNEVPFISEWPGWRGRMDRLVEGTLLMRKLWTSNSYFDFDGQFFRASQIFLYTKPRTPLRILISSVGEKSAALAGEYGDGLITLSSRNPLDRIRDVVFSNFDAGARKADKDPARMEKIVTISFTLDSPEVFLKKSRGHSGNFAKGALNEPDPRKIERMGDGLPDEVLLKSTTFCSRWSDVVELVWKFRELGATQVVLPSGPDKKTIRTYAKKLLPHLKER